MPFEIKPAAGFYDAGGSRENPAVPTFKQSMALQALEGKRRDEIEKEEEVREERERGCEFEEGSSMSSAELEPISKLSSTSRASTASE